MTDSRAVSFTVLLVSPPSQRSSQNRYLDLCINDEPLYSVERIYLPFLPMDSPLAPARGKNIAGQAGSGFGDKDSASLLRVRMAIS